MSYIRCTSNPEGLYVFGTTIRGRPYMQVYAFAPRDGMLVPWSVFRRACVLAKKRATAYYGPEVCYQGLRIRRINADPRTGKIVPEVTRIFKRDRGEVQVEVSYKGKRFWCWVVTWRYIENGVVADDEKWTEKKRRVKRKESLRSDKPPRKGKQG